jgi:hypothetical protein
VETPKVANIRLPAVAPNLNEATRPGAFSSTGRGVMKLKWWQWGVVGFIGLAVFNAFVRSVAPEEAPSTTVSQFAELDPEFQQIGRGIWAMTFDPAADPSALPRAAHEHCGSLDICSIYGWIDAEYAARGFPFTDRETSQQAFAYSVNRNTGFEQSLWDCRRWPQTTRRQCLAR